MNICECRGNTHCAICWAALEAAWDVEYAKYKTIGMEDCLEAKEFMWEFFEKRDKEIENVPDDADLTGW